MFSSTAVKRHYDAVAAPPRSRTRIRELRDYHNFVKRRLIADEVPSPPQVVVDVGCGKGGDLPKLPRSVRRYVGVDVSGACLEEARSRAAGLLGANVSATFVQADFRRAVDLPVAPGSVDLVNCQFVLHYLWGDEATAGRALSAMSALLRPGGTLLVTTGDADVIVARLHASAEELRFGSALHEVAFLAAPSETDPFEGHTYAFTLRDGAEAVLDACPEHLVHAPTLARMAADRGLELVRECNLTSLGGAYGRAVPAEQWEVTGLYRAFVFRRKALSSRSGASGASVCSGADAHA